MLDKACIYRYAAERAHLHEQPKQKGVKMAQGGGFSVLDYSNETSRFSFNTGAITAASLPGTLTQFGALRTAIEGIILGVVSQEDLLVFNTRLSNVPPSDENAQIERGWLVSYEDDLPFFDDPVNAIPNEGYQKKFTLVIGTADFTGRLLPESDFADLTDPGIAAFVTAFEAIARSPYGGTVNVLSIKGVGRNR